MKQLIIGFVMVLAVLAAIWFVYVSSRAMGEEMHYAFDLNDGTVADVSITGTTLPDSDFDRAY